MNSPEFKVSVVMPVYNAVKYLTVAVESAVHLPEVHEVILIEDCSPDGALAKCRELASTYSKVKLAQHPNGENRGAGASRNLGIQLAQSKYIAFLDADDYYLPNRFHECKRIFLSDDTVDGVYGATGFFMRMNNAWTAQSLQRCRKLLLRAICFISLFYQRMAALPQMR